MSNKTRKNAKAKIASAHSNRLILYTLSLFLLFSAVFLLLTKPESNKGLIKNCTEYASKSEIFHCNITNLEYVVEPAQRQLGLSGRDNLDNNQGMLFVFEQPSEICMWMKDMKFALDIVWIDESGKIVKLLKDVKPDTYPASFCGRDTRYVLEVNSGTMDRIGIGVGDSIRL